MKVLNGLRKFRLFQPKESDLSILNRENVMTATLNNIILETTLFQQLNNDLMQNAHAFHLELRLNNDIYQQVKDFPDRIFQKVLVPVGTMVNVCRRKDILIFDKVDRYSSLYKYWQRVVAYDYLYRRFILGLSILMFIAGVIACVTIGILRFGESIQIYTILLWNHSASGAISLSLMGIASLIICIGLPLMAVVGYRVERKYTRHKNMDVKKDNVLDIFHSFTEVIDASEDI